MNPSLETWQHNLLNPNTAIGAGAYALIFLGIALGLGAVVRKVARRVEPHLTDVTALRFAASFVQVLVFLVSFGLYAHVIPSLRALVNTALRDAEGREIVVPNSAMISSIFIRLGAADAGSTSKQS